MLPAFMITTAHPSVFVDGGPVKLDRMDAFGWASEKIILVPIKMHCHSEADLFGLVERLFRDIYKKKSLGEFDVVSEMKKRRVGHSPEIVVLKPGAYGMSLDLKELWKAGMRRFRQTER